MRAAGASLFALGSFCQYAQAVPWIVTNYVVLGSTSISPANTNSIYTLDGVVYTDTYVYEPETYIESYTLSPTVSSVPALSTETSVYTYDDITYVNVYVASDANAGVTMDSFDYGGGFDSSETNYYVPLTYTAESRCPTPWTYVSDVSIEIPSGVAPAATSTSYSEDSYYAYYSSTITVLYLDPSQIPSSSLASLLSYNEPYWSSYCDPEYYTSEITDGRFIQATATNTGSSDLPSGFNYSDCDPFQFVFAGTVVGSGYECIDGQHTTHGISLVAFILIWIFSWFGLFFFLGLAQNWYSFRALSLGRRARRGIPLLWGLMLPIFSCLLLIGSWAGYKGKSDEEKARLRERWDGLGAGTKFKQWLKWGFRHKYPSFLGEEPRRRNATNDTVGGSERPLPGVPGAAWHGLPPTPPVGPDGKMQYQVWDPNTRQWMVWMPAKAPKRQSTRAAPAQAAPTMSSALPTQDRGQSLVSPRESTTGGASRDLSRPLSDISPVSPIEPVFESKDVPPELPPRRNDDNGEGPSGTGVSTEKGVSAEKGVSTEEGVASSEEKTEANEKK